MNAGIKTWSLISASYDGKFIVASVYNGYIYTSSDYGITWLEHSSIEINKWISLNNSSDGDKIIAYGNNAIYTGQHF